MNILLIPMAAPYDGVKHAGGNIANFYLNAYTEQPDLDVTLITWQINNEISRLYYQKRGINIFLHESPPIKINLRHKICQIFDADYANRMFGVPYERDIVQDMEKLKETGYVPDIVLLQWTQIVLIGKRVKKYYPDAKYIAIEEDVSFLGFYRQYAAEKKLLRLFVKKYLYKKLLAQELTAISESTLTIVNQCHLLKKYLWQ